jgi:Bifunctional DNA primase/polymerase, N-terminal/Primase C terminal 1 (PriCT-1)
MSAGIFPTAQPLYAAHGIATFPVGVNKRPSVRGYPRIGLRASTELASKFADAPGLGFMCGERSRVTVLDIDTSDERLLADALSRHGPTPIIVRTASGKWHAWFQHNDERRRIRPWGHELRIDLLGTGGFVIAPPSTTERGRYEFVQGSLDDLASLPRMRGLEASVYSHRLTIVPDDFLVEADTVAEDDAILPVVSEGRRNDTLFRHCMRQAHQCDNLDALVELARAFNTGSCTPPLTDDEVIRTSHRAFYYTANGENRFGSTGSWLPTDIVYAVMTDPHLCTLLNFLQATNRPNRTFWVADGLAERLGWSHRKFQAARREAVRRGFIEMISMPSRGNPAWYRFGPATRQAEKSESEV